MDEQEFQQAETETAPTTVPESQETQENEQPEESGQPEKVFTQAEVDKIAAKAKAQAERRARQRFEREYMAQQPAQPRQPAQPAPKRTDYATDDEWIDAKFEHKQAALNAEREQARQASEQRAIAQKVDDVLDRAEALPGFDRGVFDGLMEDYGESLSAGWANALLESDHAPKILEHLAMNPEEVARIAGLSPSRQAAEVGKLETRFEAASKRGPAGVISPVRGANTNTPNVEKMTQSEYEAYRKKQGATWAR